MEFVETKTSAGESRSRKDLNLRFVLKMAKALRWRRSVKTLRALALILCSPTSLNNVNLPKQFSSAYYKSVIGKRCGHAARGKQRQRYM